jgi:hypothetical protein
MFQFLLGLLHLASKFLAVFRALAETGAGSRPGVLTAPIRCLVPCAALILVFAYAPAAVANPAGYAAIPDDSLDPSDAQTDAWAIDDAGDVVGNAHGGSSHCTYLPSGGGSGDYNNFNVIPTHDDACQVNGINNHNQIVGGYEDPVPLGKAFMGTPGAVTNLAIDLPGASASTASGANGINDAGVIVGQYNTGSGTPVHGFIYDASASPHSRPST